jgi:hypothetical protein
MTEMTAHRCRPSRLAAIVAALHDRKDRPTPEGAIRDDYVIVGYSFAQDFPLGRSTRGRFSAGVEGASVIGGVSVLADANVQGFLGLSLR